MMFSEVCPIRSGQLGLKLMDYMLVLLISGVLAHGTLCSLYFEMDLRHVLKYQKVSNKKFKHTCSRATHSQSSFHEKSTCRVAC
jgi:hypothetical protein